MRVTIRDVAEAAGVSAMAVSAVLNGTGKNVKVSPDKAELIRRLARELRYQPNQMARSLRNRKTGMVAVVFQHLRRVGDDHPYFPQLLNGVMAALFPADYTLALCPKLMQAGNEGAISDGRFDGVLWCRPDFTEASLELIQNSAVPVVMMHAPPGTVPGVPTFCADNDGAMRLVVKHLSELGHRLVAFAVDPVNAHTVEGIARRDAFLNACFASGIAPDVVIWSDDNPESKAYLRTCPPHTALVCFSDDLAGHILQVCAEHRVSVPNELSVVGFDSNSFCEGTRPRLTSVKQPVEKMAFDATSHLLTLIREQADELQSSPTVSSIYDCGLDIRESTAAPFRV
jgi:LacI family transcriptional regulator